MKGSRAVKEHGESNKFSNMVNYGLSKGLVQVQDQTNFRGNNGGLITEENVVIGQGLQQQTITVTKMGSNGMYGLNRKHHYIV